ncbi:MAG: SPOR domain-containing protein [Pseudomonadota bacterium]|nr:SPOR domain-containing protein [Pseudomonadota bacterium]
MPKDYKDSPSPRAESRLNHPLLLGMIIGVLLGIVISLAVALWLNRLSSPFIDKGRAVEPVSKIAPAQPQPPADAARAAEQAAKGKAGAPEKAEKPEKAAKGGERPRFEFYNILPGDKEVTEKEVKAAAPKAAAARPGSSPASPKPHSGEIYWLQAGAFSEEREADNLKARIALTGLEASVRPVSIPDKGTLFRVRLGPYQSLDDANRIKTTLSQNGVGAAIIRTADESRKP